MDPKLDKFKIPFLVVSMVLWVTYLFFSIAFAVNKTYPSLIRAVGIITIIYLSCIQIYLFFVIYLMLRTSKYKSKTVKRLIPILFCISAFVFLFLASSILFTSSYFSDFYKANVFEATWVCYWLSTSGVLILCSLLIRQKNQSKSITSGGSKTDKLPK